MGCFDKHKFSELLFKAKGERSINHYALHCGVSAAHISRLLRELIDTPPNPETIRKFADKAHNSVSYEQLMEAAGYIESKTSIKKENKINDKITHAVNDDPELLAFWDEMKERESLQLLFKQARTLDDKDIKQIIRIIKAIEDEEDKEE